jgi:hypothetical protein
MPNPTSARWQRAVDSRVNQQNCLTAKYSKYKNGFPEINFAFLAYFAVHIQLLAAPKFDEGGSALQRFPGP